MEKNISLKSDIPENCKKIFLGDETRIRQVLINLINNALKFTSEGGVTVGIKSIEKQGKYYQIPIYVKDTGIGIKEADIPKIFKSFEQADNTITRKYGGTGLGLNIANSFVNMMQGEFKVSSVWGEGTEMAFTILLKGANKTIVKFEDTCDISGLNLNVLIVDDIRANQYMLKSIFKKLNYKTTLAGTGLEAVECLEKEAFDICFMDLRMPVMDGFEATCKIRQELKLQLPLISFSADAAKEDVTKAHSCGMNDYMAKPFKQAKLRELIYKWAKQSN